jgi:hypothetical protein
MFVVITKHYTGTDTYLVDFFGYGPASQLTIPNSLNSATFSGTVTGTDYATGEEKKTVTVSADLTATGKSLTDKFNFHTVTPDINAVAHVRGAIRPASGSLNISGGFTFSTDDASGRIENTKYGSIEVHKV